MAYCLVPRADAPAAHRDADWVKRFDPEYWTVDFARPMMASVTSPGDPHGLRVETVFYDKGDLAGLIWESADRWSHPLLAYETARDYRRCALSFRWRSSGTKPLDALHGPTLTIEGRDAAGAPRAWYVRLWNYADGTPVDAAITLDFGAIDGGFLLPGEADPVWAGDVDRMFISLVPPTYDGTAGPLAATGRGTVKITEIACTGSGSVLARGDAMLAPHGTGIATGYDDLYHLTPSRVVRQIDRTGYRGDIVHYVGMSHFFRLTRGADGALTASATGGTVNAAAADWHAGFAREAAVRGLGVIWSLSYELLAAHCPEPWQQRAADGSPARTGWVPPSALLSPANGEAMAYLQAVAKAFVAIGVANGLAPQFQVGEPWWWIPFDDPPGARRICLYDDAARAALGALSVPLATLDAPLSEAQRTMLDAAGALLAHSTAALAGAVRAAFPATRTHLLVYLPTVLDRAVPEALRANVPIGWAAPAFDVLQIEDYDWVTQARGHETARGAAAMTARLGYRAERQHYLSGFVLRADDRAQWCAIADAVDAARARGVAAAFVWAWPQVARDGFTLFRSGDDMNAFDDVDFPIAIGREAEATTGFAAQIVATGSGHEQRALTWADARMRYDVGPGVRSEADVAALVAFFRARRGPVRAFRFRDPFDHLSGPGAATDQSVGTGDGVATRFALVKHYGDGEDPQVRRITRPVAGSVRVAIDGDAQAGGWSVVPGGWLAFDAPPGAGATIRAGFAFDVPVRFAEEELAVSRATFMAGEIASVPLIEVREP